MDTLQTLGSAMGLGLLAGIRLYATVFALGLAIRLGWFHPSSSMSELNVLAGLPVLIGSGVACGIEFLADKVPWVDSAWDAVHTFVRPIGATLLGAAALGSFDPALRILLALLCGGVAFTGHSSKAAARVAVNHSPEPFSNFGLSAFEDVLIPGGLWFVFAYPMASMVVTLAFVLLFVWLSPKAFRLLQISLTSLRSLIERWFGGSRDVGFLLPKHPHISDGMAEAMRQRTLRPLPEAFRKKVLLECGSPSSGLGLYCAAASGPLQGSIGYLCLLHDQLVFVTKRGLRTRLQRMDLQSLREMKLHQGIVLDCLEVKTSGGNWNFDVFATPHLRGPEVTLSTNTSTNSRTFTSRAT